MKLLLLLLAATLAAGCQTAPPREVSARTSRSQTGQLQYATATRSIIGSVTVNSSPDFQLQFTAGPGLPLLNIARSGSRASAEGVLVRAATPFGRPSWNGPVASAPAGLRSWLALDDVFARPFRGSTQSAPGVSPVWRATATATDSTVTFPATGERFRFVLAQSRVN